MKTGFKRLLKIFIILNCLNSAFAADANPTPEVQALMNTWLHEGMHNKFGMALSAMAIVAKGLNL